ncbi:MAG: hypothetical protein V4694_02465 [Pseudomonadota bacterium]
MFAILWFLFIAVALSTLLVWMLDNNGNVVINWLGYEVQADILTAILMSFLVAVCIIALSYLLTRIFAIRFPNLLKLFSRKSYIRRLEKLVRRHHKAYDIMAQLMLALEVNDEKSAKELHKKFSKLIKNPALNNFFLGKMAFDKADFSKSGEIFSKFGDNKNAKILVLKSKLALALQKQDEVQAIAYAKQILSLKKDNVQAAQTLFGLYKKRGLWQEAKALISEYGSDKFKDELQKRDLAVINSALALEAYQSKKFLHAIKYAKIALKAESQFLPAQEILLKSWLKLGFAFKTTWQIKHLWRENPNLIFAEIYDLTNRKYSAKNRIKAIKKLAEVNDEAGIGKLAIGLVAFRAGAFQTAKEFLHLSLLRQKTYRAYKLLAFSEKNLGNEEEFKKNIAKAEMMLPDDHYVCNNCGYLSSKWSANCNACGSYDSMEWHS